MSEESPISFIFPSTVAAVAAVAVVAVAAAFAAAAAVAAFECRVPFESSGVPVRSSGIDISHFSPVWRRFYFPCVFLYIYFFTSKFQIGNSI